MSYEDSNKEVGRMASEVIEMNNWISTKFGRVLLNNFEVENANIRPTATYDYRFMGEGSIDLVIYKARCLEGTSNPVVSLSEENHLIIKRYL